MKPNGINRAQEAGFSLIELLVSLALLGMVAAILASGLSLGQGSWRRSEEKAQASRSMFDAQTALRRLIENMQPLRSGSQGSGSQGLRSQASGSQASGSQASGSQGSGYQDLRAIEFRGSADELDGIVPLPPHIGLGGLYRLHLFRNRSARRLDLTLHAYEPRSEAASGDDETGLTTLASEIDSLELRYFGKAKGEETPNWRNEWQDQEELPSLISIKVRGEKIGVVWPELLISPRVKPVDWR
jgi:prepilin-type N-terminal cleavage/methylation domain-containing protein